MQQLRHFMHANGPRELMICANIPQFMCLCTAENITAFTRFLIHL